MSKPSRLIVVANRLPVTAEGGPHTCVIRRSNGGLVSAVGPVLRHNAGCWVGWYGCARDESLEAIIRDDQTQGYRLVPVGMSESDIHRFYEGYSNQSIWPLFHELNVPSHFDADHWYANNEMNDVFADATVMAANHNDFIWVHDYHLMLLAEALQERGVRARIGYFHHIPFPAPDTFDRLPWRRELLRALMAFHLIGFQTKRDQRNFFACVRRHFSDFRARRIGNAYLVQAAGRCATAVAFPIGIDVQSIAALASEALVRKRAAAIRNSYPECKIILAVDRLDYTKGIVERLLALEQLLDRHSEWLGRVALVQLTVPSRSTIPCYANLKCEIERQVSRINGRFGSINWTPIQYLYRSVEQEELVAMYMAADIAAVTPLRDGMNLVAKEYCAARADCTGVLVLSEFAGAAEELGVGAMLVNPFDTEALADMIHAALRCNVGEQQVRMARLRDSIEKHDVYHWSKRFCAAGAGCQLHATASGMADSLAASAA